MVCRGRQSAYGAPAVEALLAQFGEPAGNLVVEFGHGSGALAQRMLTRQHLLPSCSVNSSSLPFPTLWRLTSLPEQRPRHTTLRCIQPSFDNPAPTVE